MAIFIEPQAWMLPQVSTSPICFMCTNMYVNMMLILPLINSSSFLICSKAVSESAMIFIESISRPFFFKIVRLKAVLGHCLVQYQKDRYIAQTRLSEMPGLESSYAFVDLLKSESSLRESPLWAFFRTPSPHWTILMAWLYFAPFQEISDEGSRRLRNALWGRIISGFAN